jgi:hypothetical protein
MVYGSLRGTEKLRNDLPVITIFLAKSYSQFTYKEDYEQTNILLFQCSIEHFTWRST